MNKTVFLDRDGVIIEEKGYSIYKIEDMIILPNVKEALAKLKSKGYKLIVVTNQPTIARGLTSEEEVTENNNKLNEKLDNLIDAFYFCPHHPEMHPDVPEHAKKYRIKCDCRKPLPGLILKGAREFDSDIKNSWMIGDMITDIIAGKMANVKTIILDSVNNSHIIKSHVEIDLNTKPDYHAKDLNDAVVKIILSDKNKLKIFINTGGKGERLYPLTKDIPKPLVAICGKPVLHHLVDWAKSYGINDIVLMNGHMAEKIIEYFGDGSKFAVNIIHSNEPYPLGSGGPLKFARKYIDGRFVHISGDQLCDIDLKKMLEFHEKNNSQITVLVHKSTHPYDSDVIDIDENGNVLRFISKHDDHTGAGDLTNAGLAIIEPEILDLMEEEVFNFENYLYPILLKKNISFYAYNTDEFIHDMGTVERLKKCEDYLNDKIAKSGGKVE